MSIINLIQKIQEQPRGVRVWILWSLVFVCMSVVGGGWIFSLKYSIGGEQTANISDEISGPLDEIRKIRDEIPSLKKTFKDSLGVFFEEEIGDEGTSSEDVFLEKKSKPLTPARLPLK